MRKDTVDLVTRAVQENRRAYGLVNNRSEGCAPLTLWWVSCDRHVLKTLQAPIGPENDRAIWNWWHDARMVVCAWGHDGALHGQVHDVLIQDVLNLLTNHHITPCLGTTENGSPKHLLYFKRRATLIPSPISKAF
jgi:hypothetical protein